MDFGIAAGFLDVSAERESTFDYADLTQHFMYDFLRNLAGYLITKSHLIGCVQARITVTFMLALNITC